MSTLGSYIHSTMMEEFKHKLFNVSDVKLLASEHNLPFDKCLDIVDQLCDAGVLKCIPRKTYNAFQFPDNRATVTLGTFLIPFPDDSIVKIVEAIPHYEHVVYFSTAKEARELIHYQHYLVDSASPDSDMGDVFIRIVIKEELNDD